MITTLKEYNKQAQLRRNLNNSAENTRHTDLELSLGLKRMAIEIDENFFNKLDTVSVSFYIGNRSYYQDVVKVGKTYFDGATKMTRSRGYGSIKEIESITNDMRESMLSDSHYY